MIDWIRNLGKSAEEKRQEALTAYLDNALTPVQRQAFERELAQDAGLRETMEQQRRLKAQLRQLPRVAAPRHFTLDPAVYGQQRPATTMGSYMILRTATALVAFFFVLALVVEFTATGNRASPVAMEEAAPAAEQSSGGVVAESVESETIGEEAADEEEIAAEPTEEVAEEEPAEVAEEEATPEPAQDTAEGEAEEADSATALFLLSSPTPQPTPTISGSDTQGEPPGVVAPETLPTTAPAPAGGGPRPTMTPTPPGRDVEATSEPPQLDDDTANLATTPVPPIVPLAEPEEPPVSTFRIAELALGGLFLILLVLTLLVRRRGLS
jgi:hypothetical protein